MIPEALGIDGAGKLKEYTRDARRPRGDIWENSIWAESITVAGSDIYLFEAVHQESIVVPETIDAIRAVTGKSETAEASIQQTNQAIGVGRGLGDNDGRSSRLDKTADN